MSKWMPPKLEFDIKCVGYLTIHETEMLSYHRIQFEEWYDKEIKPLFENAIDVVKDSYSRTGDSWYERGKEALVSGTTYDHRYLLIKIEPIREETAESILRAFINETRHIVSNPIIISLHQRAKQFLEKTK